MKTRLDETNHMRKLMGLKLIKEQAGVVKQATKKAVAKKVVMGNTMGDIVQYLAKNLDTFSKSAGYTPTQMNKQLEIIDLINKGKIKPDTNIGGSSAIDYITGHGGLRDEVIDK